MQPGKQLGRRAGPVTIVALGLAACSVAAAVATASPAPPSLVAAGGTGPFAPGEAIVQFERGTAPADRREARRAAGVGYDSTVRLPRTQVVEVDGSVPAAVRRLERQSGVAYAQPNFVYEALAAPPPNDTFFGELWGLSDPALPDPGVGALESWEAGRGADQVIAVVDTGVDLTHPDIVGNLWENPAPGPDVHGFDFVDSDPDPDDYNFHGTHVAATAAAVDGNEEGVAGVAPEAEIMAVRVLDGDGFGFTDDIANGVSYAAAHGADVINLSLGGPAGGDEATEKAIEAAGAAGAIVVAAAGNEGVDNDADPHTPCALPQANLICVAALTQSGGLAGFSNFGASTVDLAGPGTGILSAKTDYGPELFSEGFDSGLGAWDPEHEAGSVEWGVSTVHSTGTHSAADSPAGSYAPNSNTQLIKSTPLDLSSERGCRVHFDLRRDIQPPASNGSFTDQLLAGAVTSELGVQDARSFAGSSNGAFRATEVSISDLGGRADVFPAFALFSNGSDQRDGAYVDDLRVICRDETYIDATVPIGEYDEPGSGNYVRFNGTSMATPHVAGVVALVRSAAPGLNVSQVVDAVLAGTSPIPSPDPSRPTATNGVADACQAIAVATGGDVGLECPGSEEGDEGGSDGGGSSEDPVDDPSTPSEEASPAVAAPPPAPTVTSPTARRLFKTFLRKRPRRVVRTRFRRGKVVFRFRSNVPGARFACRLDGRPWRFCRRRVAMRLGVGRHVLKVRAHDGAGSFDPTPVVYRFRIKRL